MLLDQVRGRALARLIEARIGNCYHSNAYLANPRQPVPPETPGNGEVKRGIKVAKGYRGRAAGADKWMRQR